MARKPVLISGIGIAGPALAYWLQLAGYSVTLVDKAPAVRTGGYVIDFWGLGYDLAASMGLETAIKEIGYQAEEMRIVDSRNVKKAGFGTRVFDELTKGRYITLPRSGLSRLLFEKIRSTSSVHFDTEITALRESGDGVEALLSNGDMGKFDIVIGADGLHSNVRKLAFGPQSEFEQALGYCVAALEVDNYPLHDEDVYVMYCRPGHMVGRFALRGRRTLFLFVFAYEQSFPETLREQKAILERIYGSAGWETRQILAALEKANSLYFDRVSQIKMAAWSHGRVALCGDAAFCVSLLAGQGSALAMVAAYVLAGELKRANGDHATAFARYEQTLRPYISLKQDGARRFAGALAPKTVFGLWFRDMVVRSMNIPGVAQMAIGREITDRLALSDYGFPGVRFS